MFAYTKYSHTRNCNRLVKRNPHLQQAGSLLHQSLVSIVGCPCMTQHSGVPIYHPCQHSGCPCMTNIVGYPCKTLVSIVGCTCMTCIMEYPCITLVSIVGCPCITSIVRCSCMTLVSIAGCPCMNQHSGVPMYDPALWGAHV